MANCFVTTDILLPDFQKISGEKWAVIACDQFTSQPEYWESARDIVGDSPSTLDLILPEAYLDRQSMLMPEISKHMSYYCKNVFQEYKNTYVYVERVQSDGKIRRGLVGAVDLECYDWHSGSTTPVRATEGTVAERIPPRVVIRKQASIELPHIMLLIDDAQRLVIEEVAKIQDKLKPAYDFPLMLGGGHISGWFVDGENAKMVDESIKKLFSEQGEMSIAVGDGNHSLATAKTVYEQIKQEIGEDAALCHPARYALAELVNIHDDALNFEPIYRIVTKVDTEQMLFELKEYASKLDGDSALQRIEYICGDVRGEIEIAHPINQLTVGTLQQFLDEYIKSNDLCEVDYIHGDENVVELAKKSNSIGFLFSGMKKDELFKSVISDGALPRKTFSMGHAEDKRYYIEARKIII